MQLMVGQRTCGAAWGTASTTCARNSTGDRAAPSKPGRFRPRRAWCPPQFALERAQRWRSGMQSGESRRRIHRLLTQPRQRVGTITAPLAGAFHGCQQVGFNRGRESRAAWVRCALSSGPRRDQVPRFRNDGWCRCSGPPPIGDKVAGARAQRLDLVTGTTRVAQELKRRARPRHPLGRHGGTDEVFRRSATFRARRRGGWNPAPFALRSTTSWARPRRFSTGTSPTRSGVRPGFRATPRTSRVSTRWPRRNEGDYPDFWDVARVLTRVLIRKRPIGVDPPTGAVQWGRYVKAVGRPLVPPDQELRGRP